MSDPVSSPVDTPAEGPQQSVPEQPAEEELTAEERKAKRRRYLLLLQMRWILVLHTSTSGLLIAFPSCHQDGIHASKQKEQHELTC